MQNETDKLDDINLSFESAWDANNGPEQSRYFMNRLCAHIPHSIYFDLMKAAKTMADVGCATGEGSAELASNFPDIEVTGYDISRVAIEKTKRHCGAHHNLIFTRSDMETLAKNGECFDAVFSSNVLEHFSNPLQPFMQLAAITVQYLFVLTPFNENPRILGHRSTIDKNTFPPRFAVITDNEAKDFQRIALEIFDTRESGHWHGFQILQIYNRMDSLFQPLQDTP